MNLLLLASPGYSVEPFPDSIQEQYPLTVFDLDNDYKELDTVGLPGLSTDNLSQKNSNNNWGKNAENALLNGLSDDNTRTGFLLIGTFRSRECAERLDMLFQSVGQSLQAVLYLDNWIPGTDPDTDDAQATNFMAMLDYYDSATILRRINAIGKQQNVCNALFAEVDCLG